ncbi:precorrin-4 C(11)-methyltransferase [Lachnospiraceae bacterium oral taxon 096]|nr:precorrin-4 C(11)-methyltransferase [Lachnospiraceae bacterium oral taxon 096]QUI95143.1 precorrin-4 C(11)-methyltransferase [Lachnospiraceae bacterium oral taxon 096]
MVYFIGAGPGDPELLTIKGKKIIDSADVIIYAGSLVNREVLKDRKSGAKVYNSATMHLEEVIEVMKEAEKKNLMTARVHTGDPAIFGAHREQMDALEREGIEFCVIPGVSSFVAAAAALKKEYTLPEVTQSIILTRMEGRTPMPEKESIEAFAKHQATMVIFLSANRIEELVEQLQTSYPVDTPIALVYKASWPEEKIIQGNLGNIAELVRKANITKTGLIVVGRFLGDQYALSKLYDKHFSHEYREAKS